MSYRAPLLCWVMLSLASPLVAMEAKIYHAQSQASFLKGTLNGVSADPLGGLHLADRAERLVALGEQGVALAAAAAPNGWILGTSTGKVLHIDPRGQMKVLFTAPEPEIFAVWVDKDGTVFAGSSPRGKVYRITGEGGTPFFDPGETYIWSLARGTGGDLLVATGTQGKLFRVDRQGQGQVVHRSRDPHLRVLLPLSDGSLLVGTAGEAKVLSLSTRGDVRTLYAAPGFEVVALAASPDGTAYAALTAAESRTGGAGAAPPLFPATSQVGGGAVPPKPAGDTASSAVPAPGTPGAPINFGMSAAPAAQSLVLRIRANGEVEKVWEFPTDTIYSLLWHRGRLWVGTGPEGHLYSFQAGGMVLEKDADERLVTLLLPDQPGPAFITNDAAALFRFTSEPERQGSYTSAPFDAEEVSSFGAFRWRGQVAEGASLKFSFRTGLSSEPDETWSSWTEPRSGAEIALGALPRGRYLQWLALFDAGRGGQGALSLDGVEASFRQQNLRPQIRSFTVLDPGVVLAPPAFNPVDQVFEPAHPNRDGIFTTLKPATADPQSLLLKQLWKKGYRSLRWTADDPNHDRLTYDLYFTSAALGDQWLPMISGLKDDYISFDETVLPDGTYRFRLVVSDGSDNSPAEALTAEQVSDAVVIDHSPPRLAGVERNGKGVEILIDDQRSPLREVLVSVDAGEWKPLPSEDGMLDSSSERFLVERPAGAKLLLVRAMDSSFNLVTIDLSAEGKAKVAESKDGKRAGPAAPSPLQP